MPHTRFHAAQQKQHAVQANTATTAHALHAQAYATLYAAEKALLAME